MNLCTGVEQLNGDGHTVQRNLR